MKNIIVYSLIFLSIIITTWSITFLMMERPLSENIKVGQTWEFKIDDNPYKDPIILHREIIDMNGEYILYIQNGKDTLSDKKFWFIINSECIYKCD